MATKVIRVDDLDGSSAQETIAFAFGGVNYTIDLNEKNAAEFRQMMKKWVELAHRRGVHRLATGLGNVNLESKQARQWLKSNGYDVQERGRIPASLMKIYRDAN